MKAIWVAPDIRDNIIDFIKYWSNHTQINKMIFLNWIKMSSSKYYNWQDRYGKVNEHNALIPRDHWLEEYERKSIIKFYQDNPTEGYRRCCFMMLDNNIVAVSPSSVYRVLSSAGLLKKWNPKQSTKGHGFIQPILAHDHWHVDISYININGTFYYLCSVLDGFSRFIVHHEIRDSMKETDVEIT